MQPVRGLLIDIAADTARIQKDMGQVSSIVGGASKTIKSMIATAFAVAPLVAMAKEALQLGDAMYKASQKFGIAVESLSALKYAADLSDVSFEDLGTSLKKLSQTMSSGNSAFDAMGITLKDATTGALRPTEAVLLDIAEAFSGYEDGARKTALAVELFGRQGASMIPLLNQGKAGLAALTDEARRLGVVMSTDAAKRAEEFNDNMTRIWSTVKGLTFDITNNLIRAIDSLSDSFSRSGISSGDMGLGGADVLVDPWSPSAPAPAPGKKGQPPDIEGSKKAAEARKKAAEELRAYWDGLFKERATIASDALAAEMGYTQEYLDTIRKMDDEKWAYDQRMGSEYQALHSANVNAEGTLVHDTLAAEMGWTQEYYDTLRNLDDENWQREQDRFRDRAEMQVKYHDGVLAYEGMVAYQKVTMAQNSFGAMAGLMDAFYNASKGKSKAAFEAYKAFAIAETIISTYASAQKTFEIVEQETYSYYAAAAAAAIVTAVGLARVAMIAGTRPGSSGGGSAGAAASIDSGSAGSVAANSGRGNDDGRRGIEVNVHVYNSGYIGSDPDEFARGITPRIVKALGDGA